jgi:methyl-accepting chemotaxis protein
MFKTIRMRIISTSIMIVIFSLTISTFFSYSVAEKYNEQAIDSTLNALASSYPQGISDWVKSKTDMIASLQPAALTADPLPALKQIASAGGFTDVYVGYANKITLFTGEPADADPTERPWYQQAKQAGHTVITPPYFDIASQTLVVTFAIPLMKEGNLYGVIGGDVSMESVINYVNSLDPLPGSFGMLVDSTGIIISHPDPNLMLKPLASITRHLNLNEVLQGDTPVDIQLNGETKRVKAMPIAGTDWYIIVVQDKETSSAGMQSLLISSIIIMVLLVIVSAIAIGFIITKSFKRLSMVRDMLDTMGSGDGDLTRRLPTDGQDEVTQIAFSFNKFVDKLSKIIAEIRVTSEYVKTAADEIATGNNDLSGRTQSSTTSLQQIGASLAQITATVSQSVRSAKEASDTAKYASEAAAQGDSVMSDVITTMGSIERASSKVSDITSVIDNIAFQTNILALNAAVEAARAGEQGRGFAVVANEVRSLAQNSAQAAKEIKLLIDSTISSVASGSELVHLASNSMSDIVSNVSNVSNVMQEITSASEKKMQSINEINRAIGQLDSMVQQNADMVGKSAKASSTLQERATGLAITAGSFKV